MINITIIYILGQPNHILDLKKNDMIKLHSNSRAVDEIKDLPISIDFRT